MPDEIQIVNAWWRAAKSLSAGQVHLTAWHSTRSTSPAIRDRLIAHERRIDQHGIDMPEVLDWRRPVDAPSRP